MSHVHQRIVRVHVLDGFEHPDTAADQRQLRHVERDLLLVIPVGAAGESNRDFDRRSSPSATTPTTRNRRCGESLSEQEFCAGHWR